MATASTQYSLTRPATGATGPQGPTGSYTAGRTGAVGTGAQGTQFQSGRSGQAQAAYSGFADSARPPALGSAQSAGTPAATGASITRPQGTAGTASAASNPYGTGMSGTTNPFTPSSTLQDPGNNLVNPGYSEQALNITQNRLLEDPFGGMQQQYAGQMGQASAGEDYLNQNLGTLQGPGQGEQYWQQVSGQFQDPFAGEQFARDATQAMSPSGASGAFYDQAMGQYDQFTGYQGPQNAQGQYGASAGELAGGTAGEAGLGQIAGQYGNIGQYGDPNLAAGQYGQTQQAFGDMPIANFDPFYDRARQLAVQSYNQGAAGRGVYGSSEALSGVGNVITDIEAQRANRSFDAEMQRTQEQRARQQLLGEQARMGDLSSQGAFGLNLQGAKTFADINNMSGQLQLDRNRVLGDLASNADSQALGAQNANIAGLNAYGDLANSADVNETHRYEAATNAMNQADRTALDRISTGADIAFRGDDQRRADTVADANIAQAAGGMRDSRLQGASNIASTGSRDDLARLDSYNQIAGGAEGDRQARQRMRIDASEGTQRIVQDMFSSGMGAMFAQDQQAFEDYYNSSIVPERQAAGWSAEQIEADKRQMQTMINGFYASGNRAAEKA